MAALKLAIGVLFRQELAAIGHFGRPKTIDHEFIRKVCAFHRRRGGLFFSLNEQAVARGDVSINFLARVVPASLCRGGFGDGARCFFGFGDCDVHVPK